MNIFETWFKNVLATGQTGTVRLGMPPEELLQLFGEPSLRMTHPPERTTIVALTYTCPDGAVYFNFDRIDSRYPYTGDELNEYYELAEPRRIEAKRNYL